MLSFIDNPSFESPICDSGSCLVWGTISGADHHPFWVHIPPIDGGWTPSILPYIGAFRTNYLGTPLPGGSCSV